MPAGLRRHYLCGTPATGKTTWLLFVLVQLAKSGATVVVEVGGRKQMILFRGYFSACHVLHLGSRVLKRSRLTASIFCSDSAFVGKATEGAFEEELEQPSTFYLTDAVAPELVQASTILTCSPNRAFFKAHYHFLCRHLSQQLCQLHVSDMYAHGGCLV